MILNRALIGTVIDIKNPIMYINLDYKIMRKETQKTLGGKEMKAF